MINPKITTERLLLRPINKGDVKAVFNYRSDKITNKYQGWIPEKLEDVETFIGKVSSEINIADSWFQFVIIRKETSVIIGDLGIHFLGDQQAEIGCTLDKKHQNRGYATEALSEVINYLFGDLNKRRIMASIDPENKSSIALVERLNFRKEAHFKESLFFNGRWVDDIVYAVLRKEWS